MLTTNQVRELSSREIGEIEYHKRCAERQEAVPRALSYEIIESRARRWWNAHWTMHTRLLGANLRGKDVLVAGCGLGQDASYLAKLGAKVRAFDLSPELLCMARETAAKEGLQIAFEEMPAEGLEYADDSFDCVVIRDILRHVDVPLAFEQLMRVSKGGAFFVINEIYSHSLTEKIRRSTLVEKWLYPRMVNFIYEGQDPYISPGERKLTEKDVKQVRSWLTNTQVEYFNFIATRLLPARLAFFARIDRAFLMLLKPGGCFLAGRILLTGQVMK